MLSYCGYDVEVSQKQGNKKERGNYLKNESNNMHLWQEERKWLDACLK